MLTIIQAAIVMLCNINIRKRYKVVKEDKSKIGKCQRSNKLVYRERLRSCVNKVKHCGREAIASKYVEDAKSILQTTRLAGVN